MCGLYQVPLPAVVIDIEQDLCRVIMTHNGMWAGGARLYTVAHGGVGRHSQRTIDTMAAVAHRFRKKIFSRGSG